MDQSKVVNRPYRKGETHRAWPEWSWDGEKFIKSFNDEISIQKRDEMESELDEFLDWLEVSEIPS